RMTMRYALSNSYNIPAVKVLNMMGVQQFVDFGKEMGIDTWQDSSRFGLSLSLGGGEVTLVDLAQVYSVFATGGYRIEPTPFKQILDDKERIMYQSSESPKLPVLDPGIAYIISDILSDNIARQQTFGLQSALNIEGHKVAVKTGTTNDKKDNLTVGYTPEFLVAVWVGNNDNTPMHPTLTSGITGAAPIWNRIMTYLLEEKSDGIEFKAPSNVVTKPCYGGGRNEYFLLGTEVQGYCFDSNIKPGDENNKQEARNPSL
ncbi:MAG TPA: penicillin-binding transpeptidase domain-containing protein, partial [Candidatus Woesebacteria bacterium]|nr:penicillin-binding transpeptidase domain-containing protein [Candidatus Woesebacteria bacterium]